MYERKTACSEPERSERSPTSQVCIATGVGRTDGPIRGEGEIWDAKRFRQLPRGILSVHGWETEQGNWHHSRHFSLVLFCGLESNLNGKWRELEDKSEKDNGTNSTRGKEMKRKKKSGVWAWKPLQYQHFSPPKGSILFSLEGDKMSSRDYCCGKNTWRCASCSEGSLAGIAMA